MKNHSSVVFYLLSLALVSSALFAQEPSAATQGVEGQSLTEDDVLLETYLEESRRLYEEFDPLHREPSVYELAEREDARLLLERSKEAAQRISGVLDYLSMWEHKVPLKVIELPLDSHWGLLAAEFPYDPYWADTRLLILYTLDVIYDRHNEILKDTIYENAVRGAEIRESERISATARNPLTEKENDGAEVRETSGRTGDQFVFPPRNLDVVFDCSWYVMAIYSFKNERSLNLLYEIACDSGENYAMLAYWACYYLAFSPGSNELLPDVKRRLKESIASFQKEDPELSRTLFNEDGELSDSSMGALRALLRKLKVSSLPQEITAYRSLDQIHRLLILAGSLEFNEKVPENERERFEIVRRELAISWALAPKLNCGTPIPTIGLKEGEEHFRIYLAEYEVPVVWKKEFYSRDENAARSYTLREKRQELKLFYENELANSRSIYTDLQKRYVQEELDDLNRALEREQKR